MTHIAQPTQKMVRRHGSMDQNPVNVIVVGGGLRGPALLEEIKSLCHQSEGEAEVVGVVLDNPDLELPGSRVRYTWYRQFDIHRDKMSHTAGVYRLPYYSDYVSKGHQRDKSGFSKFERWLYTEALNREIGDKRDLRLLFVMACYGQIWGKSAIELANSWFINTHPVAHGTKWNKENPYRGPVPYEQMLMDEVKECDLVAHLIDETVDGGIELCRVGPYPLLPYEGRQMHFRRDETMIRSNSEGDFVIAMHELMIEATKLLARKFFLPVVREIRAGFKPQGNRARRIRERLQRLATR